MVKTVALVEVSDRSPCNIQKDWLSGYDAGNHMLYVSCGIPIFFSHMEMRKNANFIFLVSITYIVLTEILYKYTHNLCTNLILSKI